MRDIKIKSLFDLICSKKHLLLALIVLLNFLTPNTVAGQNDTGLTIVGSIETPDDAKSVYVSGNYAYVAADDRGLQVIDIIDPESPEIVGSLEMQNSGRALFVQVNEGYAYVVSDLTGDFSLEVIDISDPENPAGVGYFGTQGSPRDLYVSGDYAYVVWEGTNPIGQQQGGLKIIDITDPEAPAKASYTGTGTGAQGVYVSGNYAYVADGGWSGLLIFDVSNPENPNNIGTLDVEYATKVYASGNYAYVAGAGDLQVIEVSDPQNPQTAGSVERSTGAQGMYVTGSYAYIAAYENGIDVIKITDPENPTLITTVDTPGKAKDIFVSGSHAYVADNEGGLQIIDLSNLSTVPDGGDGSDQTVNGDSTGTEPEVDDGVCFVGSSIEGSLTF
ncbi:MAG: beta-propeller domain-containing protein [Deltaproteobacteria bacterium]|nr:beta-propeller domain-containing protein [Deltaproteobacteria bacterium]